MPVVYIHALYTHVYIYTCVKYFNINVSRELKNRKEKKVRCVRFVYDLEANFNAIGL